MRNAKDAGSTQIAADGVALEVVKNDAAEEGLEDGAEGGLIRGEGKVRSSSVGAGIRSADRSGRRW